MAGLGILSGPEWGPWDLPLLYRCPEQTLSLTVICGMTLVGPLPSLAAVSLLNKDWLVGWGSLS